MPSKQPLVRLGSFAAALALLVLLTALAACGRPNEDKRDVVVGAVGAMSGPSAELGNNLRQGVELALDRINSSGGIGGRRLRVVYRDDEGDPAKAVAALQELVSKQNAVAIVGPTNTPPATAMLPYVQEAKIIQMNGGATGTQLVDPRHQPYSFRTIFNNEMMAMEMVSYAVETRGWRKLAILHDKTTLGVGGGGDLQRFVRNSGLTPLVVESYNPGDDDLSPQIARIREAKPDAILSWALGADTARALKAMQKLDYKVPYVGYSGALLKTTRDLAGDALGDALATSSARFVWAESPRQVDPLVKDFIERRDQKFGADDHISLIGVATHYDAMMLLAEAMRQARSTDGEAIRLALEATKGYKGVATDYSYGPDDHEGFAPGAMKIVLIAQEWKGTFKLAPTQ